MHNTGIILFQFLQYNIKVCFLRSSSWFSEASSQHPACLADSSWQWVPCFTGMAFLIFLININEIGSRCQMTSWESNKQSSSNNLKNSLLKASVDHQSPLASRRNALPPRPPPLDPQPFCRTSLSGNFDTDGWLVKTVHQKRVWSVFNGPHT